jgi:cytosine/adenosine deaminase-related metal-dependent hydrolase
MIIRAKVVATMDGPPIENGAVAVSDERLVDVGTFSDVAKKYSGEEIVDLGEQALLPGLINAHCHLDYTCLRCKITRQKSFTGWLRAINAAKANLSADDYVASINEGFAEAKRFGTTSVVNLTAFPELVAQISEPIRAWWFAELIDVRDPNQGNELVDSAVEHFKSRQHWGLAPHAPFTASKDLYRRCEAAARREDVLLTTHLAESREEMSMFRDATGALYDFLKEIGRDMNDCGSATPLERFTEIVRDSSTSLGMTKNRILVHLNELAKKDFDLLQKSVGRFAIVHCPRSHNYFGHSPFQFGTLRELGFNVCLGTDSLASNDDLSLFAEMRAFQKEFPNVSSDEIMRMVTVNPARALRQEDALGKIRAGFIADLIAVPVARGAFAKLPVRLGPSSAPSTSAFQELIDFEESVSWLMIGGIAQKAA